PLQGFQSSPEGVPVDQIASVAKEIMAPRRARLQATYMYGSARDVRRILTWKDPLIDQRYAFGIAADDVDSVVERQRSEGFDIWRIASLGPNFVTGVPAAQRPHLPD